MAEQSAGEIIYTVDMQTASLMRSTSKTDESLDNLQRGFDRTDGKVKKLNASSGQLSGQMNKLAIAIKTVIAAQALRGAANLVQSYQEMAERVQMATNGTAEYEMVQRRLIATANGTYRALEEAQELYIRTADSLRSMGYSTQQALDVTDSMSYAFVTNATSADRAAAATSAFSKSMNTGKVAADQWETITSAIPSVIDDIARSSMRAGETFEDAAKRIRSMGAAGKLTAQDLSEGLRESLDQNSKAAAEMANNLTDAGVRTRTAFQAVLVALEDQTGGLQAFTNGIIKAADAMLEFSGSQENIESLLTVATVAGASFAAVMAGRVVQSMLAFGATQVQALQVAAANRTAAVSAMELARAESVAAANALIKARAFAQATVGLQTHSAAAAALTVAETRAAAATTALSVAQRGLAATAGIATVAANGLRTAMAFLGGPTGLILLGAAALWQFGSAAKDSASDVEVLSKAVKDLSAEERELSRLLLARAIDESQKKIKMYNTQLKESLEYEKKGFISKDELWNAQRRVNIQKETEKLEAYNKRLAEINETQSSAGDSGPSSAPEQTSSPQGSARIKQLKDEIELLKATGEARTRLAELQKLGAEATEAEKIEAQDLAVQIEALTLAKQKQKQEDDERLKSTQDNERALSALTTEVQQATLSGLELAKASAMLKLNEYATPEQRAEVERLTEALYAQEQQVIDLAMARQLDAATGAQSTFDEEMAELKRLNEAKIIEDQRYLELKTQMETAHAENMRRIEEERFAAQSRANQLLIDSLNEMQSAGTNAITGLLSGTNNLTDAMQQLGAGILQHAVGALVEMGIAHVKSIVMGQMAEKAAAASSIATAASTGAAITASYAPAAAAASVATMGGAATAGYSAMAAAVPAMIGTLAGGRLHGGPVSADGMYRINENGRPEVFNAANGQQFMLPNTRGEVVSNKNASGGGASVMNNITITVTSDGGVDSTSSGADPANAEALAQGIRVVVVDEIERQSRPGGSLWSMQQNGRSV